ncbi:MAG: ABC transporter permease [Anaerolineae bacterium]
MSDVREVPLQSSATLEPGLHIRIQPSKGWIGLKLLDLWRYRDLLYFLVWRDIKVRYKQTIFGAAWAIIQPFMTMVVFTLFFGGLAQIPSDGIPYPVFSYAALVPWTFFSSGFTNASNSLVGSANLIKKVYFPRLTIPVAAILSGLVDFALAFLVLLGIMAFYLLTQPPSLAGHFFGVDAFSSAQGIRLTLNIVWAPFFLLVALIASLGVGLWLSAMNVQFRDVRYVVPFLTQFWLFITPIAYPSSLIQNPIARVLYALNPMTGVIEGFRWALLGTNTLSVVTVLISTTVAVILLITGLVYFRQMEKSFADVV